MIQTSLTLHARRIQSLTVNLSKRVYVSSTFNSLAKKHRTKAMPTLFTDEGNPFALRILAACYYKNLHTEIQFVKKENFKLPGCISEQLPIFEAETGKYLFSANAATKYVFQIEPNEVPHNLQYRIDELAEWESHELTPAVIPLLSIATGDQKETLDVGNLDNLLSTLNKIIGTNSYILDSGITPADFIIWGSLYGAMQIEKVKDACKKYEHVKVWFDYVNALAPFQKAAQEVTHGKGISSFKNSLTWLSLHLIQKRNTHTQAKEGDKSLAQTQQEESGGPTQAEIEKAKQHWLNGRNGVSKPREYKHPILPKENEKNILITSALPYVNNVPHLGNIIGCTLSGDVYARFCRLRNYNCLYICGTDEYGTATETKALAEGVTPQEICDKYFVIHDAVYKWFNIDFDYFGRTSTEKQTKITQDIFWKVHKNGYLLEDTVDQLLCENCNRFLADRYVEGTCPSCKYDDARGDQCDGCGKLINAVELIKPRCKICGSSPIIKTSKHLFLDLPKVEPRLRDWLKKSDNENWASNARQITKAWLADGLKPRCITRDLKWGTPVPLDGYTDKVFYVWFDAPIGYLSITANYTEEWEKWWKNPEEVTLVQFMAKDNVPFHTVVFPSSLIAADDNFTIINEISSTEYLNYEDDKFSKSRGVGVFGDDAESTGIPADIFRFYLLYIRPESQDSAFQWTDFILKTNSELLNNLGNFVNRGTMFLKSSFSSTLPELHLQQDDYKFIASVNNDLQNYIQHLDTLRLRDGIRYILNITRTGNQYIQINQPWVLAKGNEEEKIRAGTVIGLAVNVAALVSVLLRPYMPKTSEEIQNQLALPSECLVITDHFVPMLQTGHQIGTPTPLFKKLDDALGEELQKRFSGKRDKAPNKKADGDPVSTKLEVLEAEVVKQGDVVRKAKAEKASKEIIDIEVKKLLQLKKELALVLGTNADEKTAKGKINSTVKG